MHDLSDSGTLLADRDVDTVELLLLVGASISTLLVGDGIDGDGGLTGLTATKIRDVPRLSQAVATHSLLPSEHLG